MRLSPDGNLLATCAGGRIQLWRLHPESLLLQINGSATYGCTAGFTSQNDLVYVSKGKVITWDPRTRSAVAEHKLPTPKSSDNAECSVSDSSITVAPNGRIAAIDDGDGHLWWWDLDRARQKWDSGPDNDACFIDQVAFSGNSRLALIGQNGDYILKDLVTGGPLAAYGSATFGDFWWGGGSLSADGDSLAVPVGNGTQVALLGTRPGVPVSAMKIAVPEDAPRHLTALTNKGVEFYDYNSADRKFERLGEVALPPDVPEGLEHLSPSGHHVALVRQSSREQIQLSRLIPGHSTTSLTLRGHDANVRGLALTPAENS